MQGKSVRLCLVYNLFQPRSKQLLLFQNYILKSNVSSLFFHLSFPKVLYKSVLLSIIKLAYKSVLLSITCCHLSLTYHTQKYFIEAFYHLAKTWLCVNYLLSIITCRRLSLTYHSQKRILSVFYYVQFPLNM